jgi:hypothetical protein
MNAQVLFLGAFVLFVVLSPGVVFTIPGESETVEFNSGQTNPKAVLVAGTLNGIIIMLVGMYSLDLLSSWKK